MSQPSAHERRGLTHALLIGSLMMIPGCWSVCPASNDVAGDVRFDVAVGATLTLEAFAGCANHVDQPIAPFDLLYWDLLMICVDAPVTELTFDSVDDGLVLVGDVEIRDAENGDLFSISVPVRAERAGRFAVHASYVIDGERFPLLIEINAQVPAEVVFDGCEDLSADGSLTHIGSPVGLPLAAPIAVDAQGEVLDLGDLDVFGPNFSPWRLTGLSDPERAQTAPGRGLLRPREDSVVLDPVIIDVVGVDDIDGAAYAVNVDNAGDIEVVVTATAAGVPLCISPALVRTVVDDDRACAIEAQDGATGVGARRFAVTHFRGSGECRILTQVIRDNAVVDIGAFVVDAAARPTTETANATSTSTRQEGLSP